MSRIMNYLKHLIRHYPVSSIYILFIWVLSLMPIFPHTGLEDVPFIDKWTHFVMYGGTCLTIWIEYLRSHEKPNYKKLFLLAFLAPIIMSGILELLQAYCTGGRRSGEWLDFAANSTGVTLAAIAGIIIVIVRRRRRSQ